MTRDEAIAELLCMAEQLASYRKSMLTAQKIEWEAEDLAEIKAALAEPEMCDTCGKAKHPTCGDCTYALGVANGKLEMREEIARALHNAAERAAKGLLPDTASAWHAAANAVSDGSIREWLPKGERDAK